jgi:glycosyltransferase involved in cell wall biosynthesis
MVDQDTGKMKIAMVYRAYPPLAIGGIENNMQQLAEELTPYPEIERINILVANDACRFQREEYGEKIIVERLPNWLTLRSTPLAPAFIKKLAMIDSDLIHFHFPYPFGETAWLLAGNKRPYVVTHHSDIVRQKVLAWFYRPLMDKFFDGAARILATSRPLAESSPVLSRYPDKVKIVPLGIDPEKFAPTPRISADKIRIRCGQPVILFVGRLVYYKGIDVLIRAMKDIDARLIIIGHGPLEGDLRRLANDLGLNEKISFLTDVSDALLPSYFHACDFLVLPSVATSEAFGIVQLEAFACGKPVISTSLPTGVPYVNKHGVSGLVVPPGDVDALAAAMKRLLNNGAERERMGKDALARFNREFTSRLMGERVLNIYKGVIDRFSSKRLLINL